MPQASLNYYQSINVAKVKTDLAPFTSIQAAVDAITDNAAGKRYLVRVSPGTYTEKVIMEDYIDVVAVGGREETIITFTTTSHDEPTLTAENAMIKGFTIISDGATGTLRTRAVNAATAGFEMEDCILTVTNSVGGTDVCLNASAGCDIRDCVIDSTGASVTGALFTTGAQTYNVARCTFDGATDAIQETSTPTLNLEDCTIADNFNQDGGTVNIRRCRMEAVALGTAACTVSAEMTTFSAAFATADAFAHAITCTKCSFSGQSLNNAATGATTINLRDCDGIATLTNAGIGGTVNLYECGVETLTTTQGTVVAYGGRINACGGSTGTSFIWWKHTNELQVIPNMKIANALAASASGDTIRVAGGTYTESSLTLVTGVQVWGEGANTLISANDANPVLVCGNVAGTVKSLRLTQAGVGTCVTVNNAGANLTLYEVILTAAAGQDAVAMTAGRVNLSVCSMIEGDIDLSTAACTLNMDLCQWAGSGDIDTAGAFAHNIHMAYCDMGARSLNNAATGATILEVRYVSDMGTLTDAGLVGTTNIENSVILTATKTGTSPWDVRIARMGTLSNNNGTGGITIYQGYVHACGGSTGSIVWYANELNSLLVISGMKIAHALTAAGAGTVIQINPGTYAESTLTLKAGVNIVGTDNTQCIIAVSDAGNAILNAAVNCTIHNLTVSNLNAGAPAIAVTANSLIVQNCIINGTAAGDAITMVAGTISIYGTTIGAGDINLSTAICTLKMYGCRITTDPIDTAGAFAHVLVFEHCDFGGQNITSAATGATTLAMRGCTNVGTVSNAGTGEFIITASSLTTVAASAGIIRLRGCAYRVVTRTGTGDIVDESPVALDYAYHVVKTPVETLDNLASRTALAGAVTLGGSGQLRLTVRDNFADAAGIENNADAAGALDSSFIAGRTPRYVRQISVSAFTAVTTMFFGLRATVGAAVPTVAEDHFGFIWTGAAFNASSSDGAGVGQTTALTTPSTGAQHQLEAIQFRTKIEFYVDGVLVATHITVGIPTAAGALDFQDYEISASGGAATTSDVTIRNGFCAECPA